MPQRANNLIQKKVQKNEPIIPIKIFRKNYNSNQRKEIIEDICDAFINEKRIINKNSREVFDEVKEKFLNAYNEKKQNIKSFYLDKNKKTRGENKAREIVEAYEKCLPKNFGSGCGIDSDGLEINVWIPKNISDVDKNILYITATSKKNLNENDLIPQTTKREVFAHRLEDGTTEIGNGGLTILLSPETASSIEIMKEELCDIVEISLAKKGRTRKITSCYDENDKEFKGIIVSPRVLDEIEKGIIFREIKDKYNVSLTIQKSNEKIPNVLKEKKYIKLASITW